MGDTEDHIGMKLGTHVHYIISMTTTCFHDDYMFVNYNQIA